MRDNLRHCNCRLFRLPFQSSDSSTDFLILIYSSFCDGNFCLSLKEESHEKLFNLGLGDFNEFGVGLL